MQISEFELRNGGSAVSWPSGTTAYNGDLAFAEVNIPSGERPAQTIDASTSSKWFQRSLWTLEIDTDSGVTFDGYRYATGNDAEERDPVSWVLEGTDDAFVDLRPLPTARSTWSSGFSLPGGGVSYRYIRLTITKTANLDANAGSGSTTGILQFTGFQLISGGTPITWSGASATNPGGNNPGGEGPDNLLDDNSSTKLVDLDIVANGESVIVIDAGSTQSFDAYRFCTGADAVERDPTAWTVEGSSDNSSWTMLHDRALVDGRDWTVIDTQTSITPPSGRSTWTDVFTIAEEGRDLNATFTEPNETLSATATHPVTGVAAFTEPNETLSATASHPVTGAATFTEPDETLSSDATVQWFANASFTEPNETLSSAAAVAVVATALSAAEPNETLSGAAGVLNTLAGAFTEPNETLSSDVEAGVVNNLAANFTEPNETLAASAGVTVTGSLTATEPNETLACAATVAIVASAAFTEPDETLSAAAGGATHVVGAFTEPDETLSGAAVVIVSAALAATEANETLSATASHPVTGALNATEPNETLSSAAGVALVLSLDKTEPNEQVSSMVDTGVGFRRRGERHVSIGLRVGL